jgi:dihydrofolate reductase
MVVVTHHPPEDWPRSGVPIFFETSAEAAVTKARELAGDRGVVTVSATITRGCLDAGLLDATQVSLVPVIFGHGIPWLAGTRGRCASPNPRRSRIAASPHLGYAVRK